MLASCMGKISFLLLSSYVDSASITLKLETDYPCVHLKVSIKALCRKHGHQGLKKLDNLRVLWQWNGIFGAENQPIKIRADDRGVIAKGTFSCSILLNWYNHRVAPHPRERFQIGVRGGAVWEAEISRTLALHRNKHHKILTIFASLAIVMAPAHRCRQTRALEVPSLFLIHSTLNHGVGMEISWLGYPGQDPLELGPLK